MSWRELSVWWIDEVASDITYESVITPLLLDLFSPVAGDVYLDVGSGEGRVVQTLADMGISVVGVDVNADLAARSGCRVAVAEVPPIPFRDDAVDGVYSVLTVEHIPDHRRLFEEMARVVRPDGVAVVVANHPIWTAPDSTPIADADGETLWRPGEYFSSGSTEIPAGNEVATFHHRTISSLLNAAADTGWSLEKMIEQPHHEFEDQSGIPRLLACRWRLHALKEGLDVKQ